MENALVFNLHDQFESGGLEEVVLYGKFYVSFTDISGRNFRSNEIVELKGISDSKGRVEIVVDDLIYSNEYQKYHELWWDKIYSFDGLKENEIDFKINCKLYNSSTSIYATKVFDIQIIYNYYNEGYNPKGYIGNIEITKQLTLTSIKNDLNISTLKENYKNAEYNYLVAKEEYTNNLKNVSIDTSDIFERVSEYEPTSWVYVITRLLELNEGTIAPALRFTKNGGMDVENKRLTMIQKTIENLLNLYPDITLEDGEGMPYSSPRKIISDGEVKEENP